MIWRREEAETEAEVQARPAEEFETGGRRMAEQQSGEVTIIGKGAKLEGTVVSVGSLRIEGQIKGQVNADGDVMLAQESHVEADIRAQNVSVAGRFKGSIVVKGRAELARGGRVDGNITAKTLVVEEGGIFQGQSIMDQQALQLGQQPGQQPARRENIPEAERAKV
jgi:cytoskeletal protein CcmA (bactofilin family)